MSQASTPIRAGRLELLPPQALQPLSAVYEIQDVQVQAFGPNRVDSWEQRMAQIDALASSKRAPGSRTGERLREEPPGPDGLRLLLYIGNTSSDTPEWLGRKVLGAETLWLSMPANHDPKQQTLRRETLMRVARSWRLAADAGPGGFWIPSGVLQLPASQAEKVEQHWRTPTPEDPKPQKHAPQLTLRLKQAFPLEPGPSLLERAAEVLALMAKHMLGQGTLMRRGERTAAGRPGQEVVMETREEGWGRRLFCAWMAQGQSGPHPFPHLEAEMTVRNLNDPEEALKHWDALLDSLKPAP